MIGHAQRRHEAGPNRPCYHATDAVGSVMHRKQSASLNLEECPDQVQPLALHRCAHLTTIIG